MNLLHIFDSIAKVDETFLDRTDSRRTSIKSLFAGGKKISMAAAPLFLSALFNKAYGGTNGVSGVSESVLQVLQYAYRLEKFEEAFYTQALTGSASTLPASVKNDLGLREILSNESSHVRLLAGFIGTANLPAADTYQFDRVYTDVFTNETTFFTVAMAIEDTGVRAYKGRAAELKVDPATLEVALNIHSVEARHASFLRRRRAGTSLLGSGWITGEETSVGGPGANLYKAGNPASAFPSENNTTQAGQSGLYAGNGIVEARYTEAFDEPLDKDTVLNAVAATFFAP